MNRDTAISFGLILQLCAVAGVLSALTTLFLSWTYFYHEDAYSHLLYSVDTFSMVFFRILLILLHIILFIWVYSIYEHLKELGLELPITKEAVVLLALFPFVNLIGLMIIFVFYSIAIRKQTTEHSSKLIITFIALPVKLVSYYVLLLLNLYLFFVGLASPIIYLIACAAQVLLMLTLLIFARAFTKILKSLFLSSLQKDS